METKLISVVTTQYSEFFQRLFQEYTNETAVVIDLRHYSPSDFPKLIANWCTNAKISDTREFRLLCGSVELFGFHDHPDELWAAYSELPFIERLAAERIIRYRVLPASPKQPVRVQRIAVLLVVAALFAAFRLLSWSFQFPGHW